MNTKVISQHNDALWIEVPAFVCDLLAEQSWVFEGRVNYECSAKKNSERVKD